MTPPVPWHVERYRALLHVLVHKLQVDPRLRRRFDSSDVVQDALLKAHAHRDQFRGHTEAELVKWLEQVLARVLLDRVKYEKAQKRDPTLERYVEQSLANSSARLGQFLAQEQSSPSGQVQRQELVLRVAAALEQLPEDQRDVLVRRDLQGASVADIAAELGRTPKSVAALLYRARSGWRALLADLDP
jgi:RNA polymerase sigma-70 factor (ECF subfamily)